MTIEYTEREEDIPEQATHHSLFTNTVLSPLNEVTFLRTRPNPCERLPFALLLQPHIPQILHRKLVAVQGDDSVTRNPLLDSKKTFQKKRRLQYIGRWCE